MLGPELLTGSSGYLWLTVILFIFFLAPVLYFIQRIFLGMYKNRAVVGGSNLDWVLSCVWGYAVVIGLAGMFLYPFFPIHPWRMLVLRDFFQRFGLLYGFLFVFPLGVIRFVMDARWRHQFFSGVERVKRNPRALLVLFIVLGIAFWLGRGGTKDIADLFSAPVILRDSHPRIRRAEVYFPKSGMLLIPPGMRLDIPGSGEYQVEYTPHAHILLSCRSVKAETPPVR